MIGDLSESDKPTIPPNSTWCEDFQTTWTSRTSSPHCQPREFLQNCTRIASAAVSITVQLLSWNQTPQRLLTKLYIGTCLRCPKPQSGSWRSQQAAATRLSHAT